MPSGVFQPKASTSPSGADFCADFFQASKLTSGNDGHELFSLELTKAPG
jgi:hypothetical protein